MLGLDFKWYHLPLLFLCLPYIYYKEHRNLRK